MADDLLAQAVNQAPAAGMGGILGGGGIIAALKVFKIFSTPQDGELVEARVMNQIEKLKADFAEKYVSKESLESLLGPIREDLRYIRQHIDQIQLSNRP